MHDAGGGNRGEGQGLPSPRIDNVNTKESSILFWTGAGVCPYIGVAMKASYLRNVGRNRGVARVWLEGEMLLSNGWNNGDRFNVTFAKGALVYEKHPAGKRKVAGTIDRPILDTNTAKLSKVCGFSTGDRLPVTVTPDKVTVGEAVSADKVAETVAKVAKPSVQVTAEDGNGFNLMNKVSRALKEAGCSKEHIANYMEDSMAGDYANLIRVAYKYANIS